MKINFKTWSKPERKEFIVEIVLFSFGILLTILGLLCMPLTISLAFDPSEFVQNNYELIGTIGIASIIAGAILALIGGIPLFQNLKYKRDFEKWKQNRNNNIK